MNSWARGLLVSVTMVAITGCGSTLPVASSTAAELFYAAVGREDGVVACSLLAPKTVDEVEQSVGEPCETAVVSMDIPTVSDVTQVRQYGTQAQVRTSADTAFLAEFGNGWKIVAAACTAQGDRPYDCKVEG